MEATRRLTGVLGLVLGGYKLSLRVMLPDLDLKDDIEVVVDDTEFFRGAMGFRCPFALSKVEIWRGELAVSGPGVLRLGEPIRWKEAVERGWDLFDEADRREALSLAKLSRVGEIIICRRVESRTGVERGMEGTRRCSRHSFPSSRISTLAGVVAGSR